MPMDRRALLSIAVAGSATVGLSARTAAQAGRTPAAVPRAADPLPMVPPAATIPLWPRQPPGGEGRKPLPQELGSNPAFVRNVNTPTLAVYRPAHPDGSAVIICPGGGYFMLSMQSEGIAPALKLNDAGMTAFVLTYRLPGEGWANPSNVPLQDVQRAIRIVRSRAGEFNIDPARVGVLGFSAGGHVAATLANRHSEQTYPAIDKADTEPTRPAFAGLVYPVITMKAAYTFIPGVPLLLGPDRTDDLVASRSNELLVTADTSPCFIAHALDDDLLPVEGSQLFAAALRAQKVGCEMHLFQEGRHGFGLGQRGAPNELWPDLFVRWIGRVAPAAGA